MIQQLAHDTGAHVWAIASMLFFIGVFTLVVVRVWRTPRAEHQHHARLPLDDEGSERDPDSREVCDG